jgi:transcriptional regulator with XRE-family HTH domain
MLQKKLGRRISELRRSRKLTQEDLAEAVGRSVEFISLVERGVNSPSVASLADYARALKVEVKELFSFGGKRG